MLMDIDYKKHILMLHYTTQQNIILNKITMQIVKTLTSYQLIKSKFNVLRNLTLHTIFSKTYD